MARKANTTKTEVTEAVATQEAKPVVKEKKVFGQTDPILCRSIFAGELIINGIKTGISYRFATLDDDTEIEYQDVVAAIRSSKDYILKPYLIIEDKDIIEQFPKLNEIYSKMYTDKEMKEILYLPIPQMKAVINSLPAGAKESVKSIAATLITSGKLDSIKKIKVLDEIYRTEMMKLTEVFNK